MKKKSKEVLADCALALVAAAMVGTALGCVIVTKDECSLLRRQVGQAILEVSNMLEEQQAHVEENNRRYAAELEVLAKCVEAEAGNQSIDVKRAVISVILNRTEDADWPDTISEVIADPYEFATYWNGRMNEVEPSISTYEAISLEMETRSYPGLYYFDMDDYLPYGTPYVKMGNLYFSTKKKNGTDQKGRCQVSMTDTKIL